MGKGSCCCRGGPAGRLQIKFFLKGSVIKSNFNPSSQTAHKSIQLSQTRERFLPYLFPPSESNYHRLVLSHSVQTEGGLRRCQVLSPSPAFSAAPPQTRISSWYQPACLQIQPRTKGRISIFPLCARLIENQKVTFQMSY